MYPDLDQIQLRLDVLHNTLNILYKEQKDLNQKILLIEYETQILNSLKALKSNVTQLKTMGGLI